MAKAKKLPSGQWRTLVYDYTDTNGKRHYESFTSDTKKESEYLAADFSLNKEKRCKSIATFGEALNEYIEIRSSILSPASIRKYKSMSKNLSDELMKAKLKDITQNLIQKIISKESKTHAPKTIRDIHGLISSVLRHNNVNLILNTAMPKKVRTDLYIPSDDDIKKLMETVENTEMEIPVHLAAFGAMRRGEISALVSDDVSGNVVSISKTKVLDPDGKWVIKAPKSYAGYRDIEVPPFVAEKLKAKTGNITRLMPNMITSKFSHILKNAGISPFRFHDLRHYNASICHALGIPDAYIMQMGGWGNDRVLKEVYRHTMEETRKKMNTISIGHFENMQHEMQHKKINP